MRTTMVLLINPALNDHVPAAYKALRQRIFLFLFKILCIITFKITSKGKITNLCSNVYFPLRKEAMSHDSSMTQLKGPENICSHTAYFYLPYFFFLQSRLGYLNSVISASLYLFVLLCLVGRAGKKNVISATSESYQSEFGIRF